jgi:RNA polymerase sigma factor (sigma-70 family)
MKKITPFLSQSFSYGYNKEKYSEAEILSGITNNNDHMIRYIYKSFFPGIKSMVNSFRSLSLDSGDVFQEGLTRAVINIRENKFSGTSSFYTYLTSICRNVCLKELKRPTNFQDVDDNSITIDDSETYPEDLMTILKNEMDEACRQIIDLRFGLGKHGDNLIETVHHVENRRFEDIAKQLNIETDNARQRFRRCFEKFKLVLSNDHLWREMTN